METNLRLIDFDISAMALVAFSMHHNLNGKERFEKEIKRALIL